jgi:pimeloyl-ACP methyl ester carboxylesterase
VLRPESVSGLVLVDAGWEDLGDATGMTAAEFERSIGDPPEVMASMDAYLADRREFDRATWDADQERAARAAVDEKHAGHVAPISRAHAVRGSVDAMFEYRPLPTLTRVAAPVVFIMAESGAAADDTARERTIALEEVIRARSAAGQASRTIQFPGVGHNVMRYRPAELSSAILDLASESSAHHRA